MGRVGDSWDNGCIGTIKTELVHRHSRDEARLAVFDIEAFYNQIRGQGALGNLGSDECEAQ
jgi:transposase InsO family protein